MTSIGSTVTVRAPAKVNLTLRVGQKRKDGYHELETVFMAVNLYDTITCTSIDGGRIEVAVSGEGANLVPTDGSDLAGRAARLLRDRYGDPGLGVRLQIDKAIPVAGGMAGGSADAAGAIRGCNALWQLAVSEDDQLKLAGELGADVPFALMGGVAVARGRGDILTRLPCRGAYHWVFALAHEGLSTPAVFAAFDKLPAPTSGPPVEELTDALLAGDIAGVAGALVNDLQPAAASLRPELRDTLAAGASLGGVFGAFLAGSGPTCAFLCDTPATAEFVAAQLPRLPQVASTRVAEGPATVGTVTASYHWGTPTPAAVQSTPVGAVVTAEKAGAGKADATKTDAIEADATEADATPGIAETDDTPDETTLIDDIWGMMEADASDGDAYGEPMGVEMSDNAAGASANLEDDTPEDAFDDETTEDDTPEDDTPEDGTPEADAADVTRAEEDTSEDDTSGEVTPQADTSKDDITDEEASDEEASDDEPPADESTNGGQSAKDGRFVKWFRHHRAGKIAMIVLLALLLAVGGTVGIAYARLNSRITEENIEPMLGSDRPTIQAPTSTVTSPIDPFTGRALNIVVIGSDSRGDADPEMGQRSDTTFIAHISADRTRVDLVSIPRDILVTLPNCVYADGSPVPGSGAKNQKFNAAFSYGSWGSKGNTGSGAACTIKMIESFSGVRIDGFVVVDFSGFQKIIDAIGGVDIFLPCDVVSGEDWLSLPAGPTHLAGLTALRYARARIGQGLGDGSDLMRIQRQQVMFKAIAVKAMSMNYLTNLTTLYNFAGSLADAIATSLGSALDLAGLAYSLRGIAPDDITFNTIPFKAAKDHVNVELVPAEDGPFWTALAHDTPVADIAPPKTAPPNRIDGLPTAPPGMVSAPPWQCGW